MAQIALRFPFESSTVCPIRFHSPKSIAFRNRFAFTFGFSDDFLIVSEHIEHADSIDCFFDFSFVFGFRKRAARLRKACNVPAGMVARIAVIPVSVVELSKRVKGIVLGGDPRLPHGHSSFPQIFAKQKEECLKPLPQTFLFAQGQALSALESDDTDTPNRFATSACV